MGNRYELREVLEALDPSARDTLKRVLVRDRPDRDGIASALMRYRDTSGQGWADVIDLPTLDDDARKHVVQLLGELEATGK
jgi:hypothetical protein